MRGSGPGSISSQQRGKLGTIMRRFRMMRGLTQKQLATMARLAVTGLTVSNMERGATNPSPSTIMKIGRVLDIPPGVIVQLSCWTELTDKEKERLEDRCDEIILDTAWRNPPPVPTQEQYSRWEDA